MTQIRRLNAEGIEQFRSYLNVLRNDRTIPPPVQLLTSPAHTIPVKGLGEAEPSLLETKGAAAVYLGNLLKPITGPEIYSDIGLWTWLSLFLFDSVCPIKDEKRKPVADSHYILEAANWKRLYRHLLLTPYRLLEVMPTNNRIILDGKLSVHGDFTEQFVSKLYLMRIPGVAEAVDLLYYDSKRGGPRVGLVPKIPKKGDFRNRFPRRIEQLILTYDINVLSGRQLVGLLGDEFTKMQESGAA